MSDTKTTEVKYAVLPQTQIYIQIGSEAGR